MTQDDPGLVQWLRTEFGHLTLACGLRSSSLSLSPTSLRPVFNFRFAVASNGFTNVTNAFCRTTHYIFHIISSIIFNYCLDILYSSLYSTIE